MLEPCEGLRSLGSSQEEDPGPSQHLYFHLTISDNVQLLWLAFSDLRRPFSSDSMVSSILAQSRHSDKGSCAVLITNNLYSTAALCTNFCNT